MNISARRFIQLAFLGLALAGFTGCRSIGPKSVARDRYDYSSSISESWKRQTLLNIIKLRYLDLPIFVDVGQIVAGYTVESGLSVGSSFEHPGSDTLSLGGSVKYTDRPTITYTPLTGDKFVKSLMTPLPPEAIFFTIQSGWPADAIMFTSVARMNGLRNQEASITGLTQADPEFLQALELFRRIQAAGAVGMHVEQDALRRQITLVTLRGKDVPDQTLAETGKLRQLLGLSPEANEFRLRFGSVAANDRELAVQTRSLLHILGNMAAQVEVPAEHVAQGRAAPGIVEADRPGTSAMRMARILSSTARPANAYVAVPYCGHWFWIDDCDLKSKRTFAFMMMLFTLAESGEKQSLPLITIPAQ